MGGIFNLSSPLNRLDPELIGRKAYSLAHALTYNFPIPRSLVISTDVFDKFLDETVKDIHHLLLQCAQNHERSTEILEGIRKKILEQPLEPVMEKMIHEAYSSLHSGHVAVRSSATAEDSIGKSFAGQYESCLGVTGSNLLMSLKSCWASLFSVRVLHYLKRSKGFGSMAVILQEMIDADVSGVAFSINPVTGSQHEIVIEAVRGLGELLVQGKVVPDHYVVSKESMEIEDRNLQVNTQDRMMILNTRTDGCILRQIDDELARSSQKASYGEIKEIARYVLAAEKCYKRPVDIEWAFKDGKPYLLQARPVTGFS